MGYNRKNFKISFGSSEYFVNEKKGVVVCKTLGCIIGPCPNGIWCNEDGPTIPTKWVEGIGVAKCNKDDVFDLAKGKKIARARAENRCYLDAMNYLTTQQANLEMLSNAIDEFIDKGYTCCAHNEDYIDELAYPIEYRNKD